MVGIVTVDDAMDVLTEAAAEDLSIMAAVTPDEKPYFAASAWEHARHRVVWLLILMLSAAIHPALSSPGTRTPSPPCPCWWPFYPC